MKLRLASPPFLLGVLTALAGSPFIEAGFADSPCHHWAEGAFRSENHRAAEQILAQYAPYHQRPLHLEPINETPHTSVFRGVDPLHPNEQSIIKVTALNEAINDYFVLRVIRKAQREMKNRIAIVDSVLLTPKTGELTLATKAIQKNTFSKGRSLAEILADPAEPLERKTQLTKAFQDWTQELSGALQNQNFEVFNKKPSLIFYRTHSDLMKSTPGAMKNQPPMLMASKPWGAEFDPLSLDFEASFHRHLTRMARGTLNTFLETHDDIVVIIKSDNIFVDPENHLTLIDPF